MFLFLSIYLFRISGDEVIVTSSDYNQFHTEVRTITEVSSNSITLSGMRNVESSMFAII